MGADLAGVTFHVGSQCRNPANWRVGIEKARAVFDAMLKAGLKPRLLDIGGGFPVRHVKPIPSIEVIGEVVNEGLKAFPEEVTVIAEPGRYMVSDAGYFVCRVLGTTMRAGKRWMHWDAGVFGGVIETTEGLKYRIRTDRSGHDIPWNVAGPTCDSVDVVLRDEPLPSDLQEGDFIHILGHTTDFMQKVTSLEIDHHHVAGVHPGEDVALKVITPVHEHDVIYRVPAGEFEPYSLV